MNRTWFITGASRGLGLEIARAALAAGDSVAATARSPEKLADALEADRERLHAIELDVTDADAATRAVQEAVDRFGGIDVLVNNAGQAQLGWFETISDEDIRRQFDINLFGMLNVARAALPTMRERRSGLLVTISSVNGIMANAGGSIYSASKFAIEGWIEGLAQEVEPLGLRSLVIEPGMLRTDFLDAGVCPTRRHRDRGLLGRGLSVSVVYLRRQRETSLATPRIWPRVLWSLRPCPRRLSVSSMARMRSNGPPPRSIA
jgi:NAD(P)-dependent dehydrogenase (short-subunit alcohol dehydrogenase family)